MENKKRYFLVSCKCGHVGRRNFIRLVFPIRAWDAREAAAIGRHRPGVKHDHPDAILEVHEVERMEFHTAIISLKNDVYWQCARHYQGSLVDRLEPELRYEPIPGKTKETGGKKSTRNFRLYKNKIIENELHDYLVQEYRMVV
jgi:hypothetical protein